MRVLKGYESSSLFSDLDNLEFSDLCRIPLEILEEISEDAQKLRRRLLRNSSIVFLTTGYESKKFIFNLAHKYGIRSIVIDQPDSWCKSLLHEGIIEHFIPMDISQPPEAIVIESVHALKSLDIKPNGVCTFVELFVHTTSQLAKALDLPHMDPNVVGIARDKSMTRSVLGSCGFPHVKNRLIQSQDQLVEAGEHVGFPCVLKPVSGAASICVQKVQSQEDLPIVYHRLISELNSDVVVTSGALERRREILEPNSVAVGGSYQPIAPLMILEEYLDGPEVDVDLIMSDGKCRYSNVIDNGPTFEPYFAETWAVIPSLLGAEKSRELTDLAIACVSEIGFTDGVFHVELRYTSQGGPRLIEVNARMGGGPTRMIHKLVSGIDLVIEQFFIALGIPSRPVVPEKSIQHVAYAFINTRKTGHVKNLNFFKKFSKKLFPNLIWVLPYIQPCEKCIGPADGHPTWIGDVVVAHKESGEKALEIVKKIEEEIALEFQKNSYV